VRGRSVNRYEMHASLIITGSFCYQSRVVKKERFESFCFVWGCTDSEEFFGVCVCSLQLREDGEEEKRKDEAEEERRDEYNKSLGLERMKTETEINLVAEQEDSREDDGWAQKPVNLEKVYYNRKGRRSSFIYNRLINDSIIVQPKRFGATAEVKSVYVTQDKVDIAGVTDTLVKTVGSLSRHMRASKQKTTREFRMSHQRENRKSWQVE